jgi:hypothetical protein
VHPDFRFGPVVHGAERHDVGVFELSEPCFYLGLGAVGGDDVGDGPVVTVGEQDPFAEQALLKSLTGADVGMPGQA